MEVSEVLLQLAIILLAARIAGEIVMHLGAPSVIGELLVGVILGPSQLGWIHPGEFIRTVAEIGIILLLFQVGLEANVHRLAPALPRTANSATRCIGKCVPSCSSLRQSFLSAWASPWT